MKAAGSEDLRPRMEPPVHADERRLLLLEKEIENEPPRHRAHRGDVPQATRSLLVRRCVTVRREIEKGHEGIPHMKALEFQTRVNPDGTVTLPPDVASQVHDVHPVRVILLIPESAEDREWANLTAEQFLKGYAPGDAIYDEPSGG